MEDRSYKFTWDFIGDVKQGRPNLGEEVPVAVYRLFQYTLRDAMEEKLGTEEADKMMRRAGFLAGRAFCEQFIPPTTDMNTYFDCVQKALAEHKVGIVFVENVDLENDTFTVAVAEDLDCSGLPEMGHAVCSYDEGFVSGIFYNLTKKEYNVKEIDCWCTGGRTCRFEIKG